ncbi:hypothetical protein [Clostridium beijerinckii]|uniref:hypothetical protein n=1 Tax=Clostridium beijerinckii TaxID=1520 RepID=UPI00047B1FBC|nr:hypothetical protein [Clostridium beijerinckii]
MSSSISNHYVTQNMSTINVKNNANSKATEEANESASEKRVELSSKSSETKSNHIIDSYA